MNPGQFIWADLSTYDTGKSIEFYKNVFRWNFENKGGYHLAFLKDAYYAAIFETPDFLKKLKMPHFWMSYFQVKSVADTVLKAKEMGAIIEVNTTDFNKGKIALIRDPQGAGFTVYDGADLSLSYKKCHGSIVRTELHVSNLMEVLPFYKNLFGWDLIGNESQGYSVNDNIYIRKLDNELKGKYEYWVTTIQVDSLEVSRRNILRHGGSLISNEGARLLMSDNSNEAFFYIQE